MAGFIYDNKQHRIEGGKRIVHRVTVKNGRGTKRVSIFLRGRHVNTRKKRLTDHEIDHIKRKKFIPGLFNDLMRSKTRRRKFTLH
jgi:hypothetical protein